MKYFIAIALFLLTTSLYADVFQQSDDNGSILYTDEPTSKEATMLKNLNGNIVTGTTIQSDTETSTPSDNEKADSVKSYTTFSILTPSDNETIQNQPTLTFKITINPSLQKGDKIQVYLDGKPWGIPLPSTERSFITPDRGTHSIHATLLNQKDTVMMTTKPVVIYVHQAHIGNQPNALRPLSR